MASVIETNLERDTLFDSFGLKRLRDSYMLDTETSPQERFAYIAERLGSNLSHAQRLYEYTSKQWLSLSTPILSLGKAKHGLPISCYLCYLEDTSRGLLDTLSEANELSMLGGGVGVGIQLRSADNKSTGVMPHVNTYNSSCLAYKQDGVRRGSYAMYLDINHPEIMSFIDMRKATGDHNFRCLNLHHAINVSDEFMRVIEKCVVNGRGQDDSWPLIDPHTLLVKKVISARDLWQRILETRMRTGEPYLCFIDTCNKQMPQWQKVKGLKITQSNLCVTGDTRILTAKGNIPIRDLQGERVSVWNGHEFSNVLVIRTGVDQELMRVTVSDGSSLTCTPYHKFILHNGTRISAMDLAIGECLMPWHDPCKVKSPDIRVCDVVKLTTKADTFCFNEPKRHAGVFNGILTGQCSEIILPTDRDRTAVCCLSSLNLERYDEWKDEALFIKDVCEMLDNALQMFIDKAPPGIRRAKFSAEKERSIGIGELGWHAYLQSKNIALESAEAAKLNAAIFSGLARQIDAASLALGAERGEPDDAKGTGRRFCCTRAIAPNATSSIIMGNTSPSIEPFRANAYRQDTLSGSHLNKNKYLDALLKTKGVDADAVWNDILLNSGSVQHLDFLSPHEKNVFKTAFEIDQTWLIRLAASRQPYIDQSQSLNIFLPPDVDVKLLHAIHFDAWKLGLKTLYYLRSTKIAQVDKLLPKAEERVLNAPVCARRKPGDTGECLACE